MWYVSDLVSVSFLLTYHCPATIASLVTLFISSPVLVSPLVTLFPPAFFLPLPLMRLFTALPSATLRLRKSSLASLEKGLTHPEELDLAARHSKQRWMHVITICALLSAVISSVFQVLSVVHTSPGSNYPSVTFDVLHSLFRVLWLNLIISSFHRVSSSLLLALQKN